MRINKILTAGIGLLILGAAPAMAGGGTKIYPYHAENFCPAGLQPITISGVICCGQPNQHSSYQDVKMTPAPRKKVHRTHYAPKQSYCPVGTKGCS